MKKILLFLAMMLPCLGAWAQEPVLTYENITSTQELSAEDAAKIRGIYSSMTIVADVNITNSSNVSVLFAAVADYTSNSTSNNSVWALGTGGNSVRYIVGPRDGGWYSSTNGSLTTSSKSVICTVNGTNIDFYVDGLYVKTQTSTKNLDTFSGENAKFYLGGLVYNNNTDWGAFNGQIKSLKIYNSVLTAEQISAMFYPENAVIDYTKFVHGNVYTFQTKRGWLMAKEGTDFVYSSGKLNDVTPAEDNVNCQWVYYATEKGKYLYNVAVNKFVSYNSTNLNSLPLSENPTTSAIEFKNSTLAGYPVLVGVESKVINQNLTNDAFTYGALLWGDGWTGHYNDEGSATLALSQGEATAETLAAIKVKVDAFEADNTLAVAELNAKITTVQAWFEQYVGTGVGKYSATDDEYESKFEAIVAFRNAIQATNTPSPAEVEAKTAELEALVATFQLNMPEAGKFYRINNGENYITSNVTDGKIALSGDYDNAASVYYYDGTHLLAFNTGLYMGLNASDWAFEAVGSNDISAIEFVAAANGAVAKYNIKSGGRWLHKDNGFVNRCQNNTCGDSHNWTITEVTWLPIPVNVEAGWTTLYSPVELALSYNRFKAYTAKSIEGNSVVLEEQTVVPANVGVVLELQEGAQVQNGCVFLEIKATETEATSLLEGTYADTYVAKDAYVLSRQMIEEEYVVGLFKATKNQQGNTSFLNNGFKAYLPTTQGASMQVLRFNFGGNTTAIETVVNGLDANAPIYDLSGRRVVNAVKGGLYIQNGKKFIVK